MLEALRKINEDWAKHDPSEGYVRSLDVCFYFVVSRTTDSSSIDIQATFCHTTLGDCRPSPSCIAPRSPAACHCQDRTLYRHGEAAQPTSSITWTYWIAVKDHLCSASPPHAPLDPFIVPNVRSAYGKALLSSLAMVINAHYKLNQFMRDRGSSASPRVQWFAEQMSDLVTEIFFVPQTYSGVRHGQFVQVSRQGHQTTEVIHPQSSLVAPALEHPLGQNYSSGTTEDRSEPPGEDVDAVEPPETPDADGLTDSEFHLVAARAKDPLLDPRQRAAAAMTMIFGTRRKYRLLDPINL